MVAVAGGVEVRDPDGWDAGRMAALREPLGYTAPGATQPCGRRCGLLGWLDQRPAGGGDPGHAPDPVHWDARWDGRRAGAYRARDVDQGGRGLALAAHLYVQPRARYRHPAARYPLVRPRPHGARLRDRLLDHLAYRHKRKHRLQDG